MAVNGFVIRTFYATLIPRLACGGLIDKTLHNIGWINRYLHGELFFWLQG